MNTEQLISITHFCQMGEVEFSFIEALQEHGLLELIVLENVSYISNEQLKAVERAIAFYYVLNINLEGIAAISDLLLQIESLRLELQRTKNKLSVFETT
jgi:chaperone modulatory protein CbpM